MDQRARAALRYGATLARALGASLRLISVIERHPDGTDRPSMPDDYVEATLFDGLRLELEEQATALRVQGLCVTTDVVFGDPADEILAAADAADVAMTVMATHGSGGFERLLVDSVADKVMRMNLRPTLLVSPAEQPHEPGALAINRVIVPLDGSALAETALPIAEELAGRLDASLTLVRVEPLASVGATPYVTVADVNRLDADIAGALRTYLEKQQELVPSVQSEVAVLRGYAPTALSAYGLSRPGTLMVLATHGRGGFRRFILGSTADRLVRSGVPVLLIHSSRRTGAATLASELANHCAKCGRLITILPAMTARCPRCQTHLHAYVNCVFWDTTSCVLQRAEAYQSVWPGRDCLRFIFRATPS
jgi:nucleotide-binding universal stress UspA family protein